MPSPIWRAQVPLLQHCDVSFRELTGMLPVTIEAAEISQAFATGVAEAMISSGATGYDRKVWESMSHFYEVNGWLPRNYVMVNNRQSGRRFRTTTKPR